MSASKLIIYSFIFISIILVSCNKKETKKIIKKPKSDLAYAMLPREDTLPKLSENEVLEKRQRIEAFVKKNWSGNFENLSFLVAKNGQIIDEHYEGFANKSENELITAETPLHIASVSKVLTASAILKLIDAKKIGLDDFVTKYLQSFPYPTVTIRTLLNHRSGIRKYGYFADDKANWSRNKTLTNADILKILIDKKIPLEYKPDTHFSYCNTNYVLLALVIEKVTKMKYKKAMEKIIFKPLNMNNTFVFDEETDESKATPSYKYNYQKYPFDYLDAVYGDKNIYSTPRDLLKFDLARNAPNFVSKSLRDQIYKGYSYESRGTRNYGLGIRLHEWESGQKFFYHNGWWHGNTSSYNTLVKQNVVIIALSNKFTTKTYKVKNLAVLFGDYPFKLNDDSSL
jgi:CubicO group peptidase (beta-lactamase class C family)